MNIFLFFFFRCIKVSFTNVFHSEKNYRSTFTRDIEEIIDSLTKKKKAIDLILFFRFHMGLIS